ncbi:MAG: AsmA-like C-terminal region-containing protein [Bacteroidales bacterium]
MKKTRIFIEYLAAFLIILFLLSVIAGVVISKFYGDDLQEHALELLNEQLDTKVTVEEIGISVFKNFPNTSLYLKNVIIYSGYGFNREEFLNMSPDTLLTASRIYLTFNLPDLIQGKFSIQGLEARDGIVKLFIDKSGIGNYLLGKKKQEAGSSRLIEMKGVNLRNVDFQYINLAKDVEARGSIRDMFLEGNFFNQNYRLKGGGDAYIYNFINHGVTFLHNQEIKSDIALQVEKNHYSITKGQLILGEFVAGVTGAFLVNEEKGADLDLQFTGRKIDLEWITGILVDRKISPKGINGKGKIDLSIVVSGELSPTISPYINATFSTQNALLDLQKNDLKLRSISLNGSYTNGPLRSVTSSVFQLHSVNTSFGNSGISGSMKLQNFTDPSFEIDLSGDINAIDLQQFIKTYPVTIRDGRIRPSLTAEGAISGLSGEKAKVTFTPVGEVEFTGLHLTTENPEIDFSKLGGKLDIQPEKWKTEIEGYVNETDFRIDISTNNPLKTVSGAPILDLEGSVYSSNLDVDRLLLDLKKEEGEDKKATYPEHIRANLDFSFDKITRGDIQTEQISGTLIYKYPGLYIDPVYLETMSGAINARLALIDLHKPIHRITMSSSFRNVEIADVFKTFNNFGQEFLTHENIEGSLSGDSEFYSAIQSDFSFIASEIVSENSFIIENGELIDFQPIIELSRFLKISEMDHIQFSNLRNTIMINNNIITIPQMDIRSSALNLQASGTHGFNKMYEYHLAIKLSDLLFNRAKSMSDSEFNIALDKDDNRTVFLILYDTGNGISIEFDEAQAMGKIREDLRNEKTELKGVLNREFGLFDKDEAVQQNRESVEKPILEFDFSDEEATDSIDSKQKDRTRWWKRNNRKDKKPEFDFVIDDSDF